MRRALKIVFVIKAMGLPGGGAERVLSVVADGLIRRGHHVTIVSRDPPVVDDYYRNTAHRLRQGARSARSRSRVSDMATWVPELRRAVVGLRPDVAVGFMHSSYIPLGLALVGSGIPVIASEHTVYEHYRTRPKERVMLHLTPWLTDTITVVSAQAKASFPHSLRMRMKVLPNPVQVSAGPANMTESRERWSVVAVGRLDAAKDHATLIAAFAQLADRYPSWDLNIAGEGESRPQLERQIQSLDLCDRVRLLGAVSDINNLLRRSDIFAMASRYESFGLATAEALACNVPAIGFADCAGTNELIVDGLNGLLIDPGTDRVTSMAEGLEALIQDAELRNAMAANAPRSIAQYHEPEVVEQWASLLHQTARPSLFRNLESVVPSPRDIDI